MIHVPLFSRPALAAIFLMVNCAASYAQVVPGTGFKIQGVGDNFEAEDWNYVMNLPKGSNNIDKDSRFPGGGSTNGMWSESALRGQPDVVKRVLTPPGGIEGSKGSMLIRTLRSGTPYSLSYEQQQDDLLANVSTLKGAIPVSANPSVVCRVYIPKWEEWEQRTGSSFGFRADLVGRKWTNGSSGKGFFRRSGPRMEEENYWPGFFIAFNCKKQHPNLAENSCYILVRSGPNGEDITGPIIKEPGWWTLGMSFTGDGRVHYYAHEGTAPLTAKDHITSQAPYGFTAHTLYTYFFNVVNNDDGRSWSTPWVVDECEVFWNRAQ